MAILKVLKQTILQGPFFTRSQPIDDAIERQLLAQALNPSGFKKIPLDEAKFEAGTRLVKTYTEGIPAPQGREWSDPLTRPTATFARYSTANVPLTNLWTVSVCSAMTMRNNRLNIGTYPCPYQDNKSTTYHHTSREASSRTFPLLRTRLHFVDVRYLL